MTIQSAVAASLCRRTPQTAMQSARTNLNHNSFNLALLLFACLFLAAGSIANAQSEVIRPLPAPQTPGMRPASPRRPTTPPTSGQSSVKGRVVYDNAQPLKGVRVQIFTGNDNESDSEDDGPPIHDMGLVAFTNNRGEFQVGNLAAGKYYIAVEGPGIGMPSGMGMRIPLPLSAIPRREDFAEIIPKHDAEFAVDGTNTVEVEVRIARGGSISGKVLKANGAPVADVPVSFISRAGADAGPYMARFSAQTDKDGAYRIENLPAGDYVVAAAIEDRRGNFDMRARLRGESQVVTYHPAAIRVRDAASVRVDPGRETSGVNITLVARNAYAVSGTVVRQQDGTVIAGATVLLVNKEAELGGALVPGLGQRTARSDADGHWSFTNVTEGSYVVTALVPTSRSARLPNESRTPGSPQLGPPQLGPPDSEPADREQAYRESRQRFLFAHQEVAVAGADLSGLPLAIVGPGSITGVVETDNGARLPADLVIFLELSRPGDRPSPPMPVRVKPDGSFSVSGIQGGDVFLALALTPASQYFIKSVTANGDNPQHTPLKVIEGAEVGPLRVIISTVTGSLSGRVLLDKSGQGLSDIVVLLAPVEPEKQRFRTTYLSTRTTSDGNYSLTGAPGEYFVFARRRDELPGIVTAEFVRAEAAKAQRVMLVSGERERLDLRIP
jgi:hypothetical protein